MVACNGSIMSRSGGFPRRDLGSRTAPALVSPSNRYPEGAYFLLLRLAFSTSDESLSALSRKPHAYQSRRCSESVRSLLCQAVSAESSHNASCELRDWSD